MATVQQIKLANEENIRSKTAPGSILKEVDANMRDVVANELRDRGLIIVDSTASLATHSKENTKKIFVEEEGLFVAFETSDEPDDETTFASADVGWLWKRVLTVASAVTPAVTKVKFVLVGEGSYTVEDGNMVDKILIKAAEADTVKIGLTEGGDEIMMEEELAAGKWKSVAMDVIADGEDQQIYFTGITDEATIIIYKREL